jgi:hypothetical protein
MLEQREDLVTLQVPLHLKVIMAVMAQMQPLLTGVVVGAGLLPQEATEADLLVVTAVTEQHLPFLVIALLIQVAVVVEGVIMALQEPQERVEQAVVVMVVLPLQVLLEMPTRAVVAAEVVHQAQLRVLAALAAQVLSY